MKISKKNIRCSEVLSPFNVDDCIDFTIEEYCDDLLYVKTLDLGSCTLNEI